MKLIFTILAAVIKKSVHHRRGTADKKKIKTTSSVKQLRFRLGDFKS